MPRHTKIDYFRWGIQVVGAFFGAFHGYLRTMAPPEEVRQHSSVGFASFVALFVILFISALAKSKIKRRTWLLLAFVMMAAAAAFFFTYEDNVGRLTFAYPPDSESTELYVKGTVLTPQAAAWKSAHNVTEAELVAQHGGIPGRELVWQPESIHRAKMTLLFDYVGFVTSLAVALFSLTEVVLPRR